jgi:hypothetical protein
MPDLKKKITINATGTHSNILEIGITININGIGI